MAQQHELPHSGVPDSPSLHPECPARLGEPASLDARIEDYLDHLCVELVGRVPYARRQELRAEWRAHLEARIEAYEELGCEAEEATEAAIRQFGSPRSMGRAWAREWTRTITRRRSGSVWPGMAAGLACFTQISLFSGLLLALITGGQFVRPHGAWGTSIILLLMPLLGGLLTGFRTSLAPDRAALGVFYALSALIPLTAGIGQILLAWEIDTAATLALIQFTCWIPVGCLATAAGGWLRDGWEWSHRPWLAQ